MSRDDRVFRWICRRAIASGSTTFRTTYAEAAAGADYEVPILNCRENRLQARSQRVSTVYRALCSLEAAGLVRFHGHKTKAGKWRCLQVSLLEAAYEPEPAFGHSTRAPSRRPGHRISFCRRSGTSPTEGKPKATANGVSWSARAREPSCEASPDLGTAEEATKRPGSLAHAMLDALEAVARSSKRSSAWPHERWDLSQTEVVALVEHFEEEFGFDAKFSFERHGPQLIRTLTRFDRFSWADPELSGPHAGYAAAWKLIRRWGRLYRAGNRRVAHVASLPYFLPRLEEASKRLRHRARRIEREESRETPR